MLLHLFVDLLNNTQTLESKKVQEKSSVCTRDMSFYRSLLKTGMNADPHQLQSKRQKAGHGYWAASDEITSASSLPEKPQCIMCHGEKEA